MGANGDPGVRRAARLADTWFINPHARLSTLKRQIDLYRQTLAECGKPWPEDRPIMREIYVASSREAAHKAARPLLEAKYRTYQDWGQAKAMPKEDSDLGMDFEALAADRFFIGTPQDVAEQIAAASRILGVNHFVFGQKPGATHAAAMDEMRLLAEAVIPATLNALG
jgi:alkanesulfonate monooxygenase SsuD/methylene tetrahydromethanopterin reductase-like flavin-dependent oxidoreductase (luciferase family)